MSGAATTKLQRFSFRWMSFLYTKCPEGNYHLRWHWICWCVDDEYVRVYYLGKWTVLAKR